MITAWQCDYDYQLMITYFNKVIKYYYMTNVSNYNCYYKKTKPPLIMCYILNGIPYHGKQIFDTAFLKAHMDLCITTKVYFVSHASVTSRI